MKHTVTFYCITCGDNVPMDRDKLVEHLKNTHHHKGPIKGVQQAVSFLDGAKGYYQQQYEIKLDCGVTLDKIVEGGGK